VAAGLTLLALGLAAAIWLGVSREIPIQASVPENSSSKQLDDSLETNEPPDPDERLKQQLVGVWTDNYRGKRTMTLRDDGTGEMDVELEGATAMLFAEHLHFDMVWRIEEGKLIKESIGGQPAEKVNLILKTMGRRAEETVLEVTKERLRTRESDRTTVYDWQRVR
jgi:hypothetical protein